jgi:hypothetical protein
MKTQGLKATSEWAEVSVKELGVAKEINPADKQKKALR